MKTGTIVVTKDLSFADGTKDKKKHRPCIFLFDKKIGDTEYAYIMPLTTKVNRFNKDYERYIFIPQAIYSERKLSFAKADGIVCVKAEEIESIDIVLDDNTMNQLLNKVKEFSQTRMSTNKMEDTIEEFNNRAYCLS